MITFEDGSNAKPCDTVGEVIEALKQLPKDTPVSMFDEGCDVVILKRVDGEAVVEFVEKGEWS